MTVKNKLVAPTLRPIEEKEVGCIHYTRWETFVNWLGFQGYDKLTWEYGTDETPSKAILEHQPGKTLLDLVSVFVSLLGVVTIAATIFGLYINVNQFNVTSG